MAEYILDENLSRKLVDKLTPVFLSITHVANEGLLNSNDGEIWNFAKNESIVIITKDNDFADMSHLYGCPPKVVKLNCGNKTTDYIENVLATHYEIIKDFTQSTSCYMEMV